MSQYQVIVRYSKYGKPHVASYTTNARSALDAVRKAHGFFGLDGEGIDIKDTKIYRQ